MRIHNWHGDSDPLKSARLRQFLNEGWQRYRIPALAESVLGFLQVSLILFLLGLCEFVIDISARVGTTTVIISSYCGLLYVFVTLMPIQDPQSPFQTPISGFVWYLFQGFCNWIETRGHGGAPRHLSLNTAEQQMQLAMEETKGREGRDGRAIQWLVGKMTVDAEMDLLVKAIPDSLNAGWGFKVWKQVIHTPTAVPPPSPPPNDTSALPLTPNSLDAYPHSAIARLQEGDIGHKLRTRVAHLLETCRTRSIFQDDDAWRRRTRACVETVVSLVCCDDSDSDAELEWFGNDIVKLLEDIGEVEGIGRWMVGEAGKAGKDQSFVRRWSCLSLIVIRRNLKRDNEVHKQTDLAIKLPADIAEGVSDSLPRQAQEGAQRIDECFKAVCRRLQTLYGGLHDGNLPQEQVSHILESEISELERIHINVDDLKRVDVEISRLQSCLREVSRGIITQRLLGVQYDEFGADPIPFGQTIEWLQNLCFHQSTLLPGHHLESVCSLVPAFRSILKENPDTYEDSEVLKNLKTFAVTEVPTWDGNVFQRQLWRLQDLRDSGGLGFAVELFFVALKQFSASPRDPWLYIGTFKAITSDWRECRRKRCLGTQKLLLDIVTSSNPSIMIYDSHYPDYITDELLTLLENVLEQQTGEHHIDDAVQKLTDQLLPEHHTGTRRGLFGAKALRIISRARTSTS